MNLMYNFWFIARVYHFYLFMASEIGPYVVLWKKGVASILYAGGLQVLRDPRIKLDVQTNSLLINEIKEADAGLYTCQVCLTF